VSADEHLSPEQFTTLYHGTRLKHVDSIREHGLTPPEGVNPAGWPMLTDNKAQAERYAGDAVLEFHVPTDRMDYRAKDGVLWPGREHNAYGHPATAYGVKGRVPGDMLAAVHPKEKDDK
jgi:hypothetical protein